MAWLWRANTLHNPQHFPNPTRGLEIAIQANSPTGGAAWVPVYVPSWAVAVDYVIIGGGGRGGNGAVGLNSAAAGGGGAASGCMSTGSLPLAGMPKVLYASVGFGGVPSNVGGQVSRLAIAPDSSAQNTIALANGGNGGGSAAGATAGSAGSAGAAATIFVMPLAGLGTFSFLQSAVGIIGGVAVAGANAALPVTGAFMTGGAGGGGLPAAGIAGTNGGGINAVAGGFFPAHAGGLGSATATVPPGNGNEGLQGINGMRYNYGGTGGGSSHGTATGAGLAGGNGGKGAIGSGGGGGGGALTGSVQGLGGDGGNGLIILTFR